MDFGLPADHRVKPKENEKKDKYLNLAKELKKKLRDVKVTVIPIVIGALGTASKGLIKCLEDEWRPSKGQHYHDRPGHWE